MLAVWFEPENMAVPMAVSQSAELLRSIVSLLAMPGTDADAARSTIESFVVPVLTAPPIQTRSHP